MCGFFSKYFKSKKSCVNTCYKYIYIYMAIRYYVTIIRSVITFNTGKRELNRLKLFLIRAWRSHKKLSTHFYILFQFY
jgi:hypothetical protein